MNAAQRNHMKKQIQELKYRNTSLTTGIIVWALLGILLFFTIVVPYIAWGLTKQYRTECEVKCAKVKSLEQNGRP